MEKIFIVGGAVCFIFMGWFGRAIWDTWRDADRFAHYKQQLLELGSERVVVRVGGAPILDISIFEWRHAREYYGGSPVLKDIHSEVKAVSVSLESGPYGREQINEIRGYGDQ